MTEFGNTAMHSRIKYPRYFHGLALLIAIVGFASTLRADPVISLPLDGYYRPGKFFPVHVTSDQPVKVQIDIDNGIGSRDAGTDLTLPVMLLSLQERSIRVMIDGKPTDVPVRALEANQKLMMVLAAEFPTVPRIALSDASAIVVSVQPQPNDNPQVYESADLLGVPDSGNSIAASAALHRTIAFGRPQIRIPLSAVQTPFRPPPSMLLASVRGPTSSLDDAGVMNSFSGIVAEWPEAIRRTVWLVAAAFVILVLAAALFARRWAAYVIAAISATALIVGGLTLNQLPDTTERQARVIVEGADGISQHDRLILQTALRSTDETFNAGDAGCRPLFAGQLSSIHIWIEPVGRQWRFHYRLPRGQKLLFVCRDGNEQPIGDFRSVPPTLFDEVVHRYYQRTGDKVVLEHPPEPVSEVWNVLTP